MITDHTNPVPQSVYPSTFAPPSRANYSGDIVYPVVSTMMQSGHEKRRLIHPYKVWSITMTFMMPSHDFYSWHAWVHKYGFYWFSMDVQDDAVVDPDRLLAQAVAMRFTGNASWQHGDWGYINVTIPGEAAIKRSAK